MAALQSRGGGASYHHRQHQHHQYDEGETENHTEASSRREQHQQHQGVGGSSNRNSALGLTLNDEAWVLFAPKQSADNADRTAQDDDTTTTTEEPADPFEQEGETHTQSDNNDNDNEDMSTSSTSWHLVHPSTSVHHDHTRSGHATQDTASGKLEEEGTTTKQDSTVQASQAASGSNSPASSNDNGDDQLNVRWSAVPRPRRDTSFFFDDDEDDVVDGVVAENHPPFDIDDRKLIDKDNGKEEEQDRIHPTGTKRRSQRRLHDYHVQPTTTADSQDGGDTDMLSLPSSLSVSERSASSDLASPAMFDDDDYQEQGRSPSISESAMMEDSQHYEHQLLNTSTNTLTEAALSRMTSNTTAIPGGHVTTVAVADEAINTSGSEDEAEGLEDTDEALLSRAPDAISAGIRAVPRRQPLQSIRTPSQNASSLQSGSVIGKQSSSSTSCRSVTKRRHRQAGVSDKGSKRSNTSASVRSSSHVSRRSATPLQNDYKGNQAGRQHDVSLPSSRRSPSTLAQMTRSIFAVDEEVLNMMAQPGSVFNQPRPSSTHRQRRTSDRSTHGFSALSAQMASELGETPGLRNMFGCYDQDEEEEGEDSGDETETEQYHHHHSHRFKTRHTIPTRRHRRRSSLFADHFDRKRYPQLTSSSSTMAASADLLHTQSLGLHRSFSLASLQHFLVDSVYNSLSSSMLGTPGTPSSPIGQSFHSDGDLGSGLGLASASKSDSVGSANSKGTSSRKRTISVPYTIYSGVGGTSTDRLHSSDDLLTASQSNSSGSNNHNNGRLHHSQVISPVDAKQEAASFRDTVSYWRRVLRSFAF